MENNNIAIFFDAENVSARYVSTILAKTSSYGNIVIQRAYADWSIPNTKQWKEIVARQPINVIQQFHNGETQVIDKTIIMDAIQIAIERPEINVFFIVASDKGYANLALRLRELGKRVVGIGEETKAKQDSLLVNACNEFLYVERIKHFDENILLDSNDSESREIQNFSLLQFINQAYDITPKMRDSEVLMSQLGESIKKIKPDFDYMDYKFSSLKQIIESFSNDYEISNDGKTPPTFFISRKEKELHEEKLEGTIKRLIKNYGIISTDDATDYFFYNKDILPEFHKEKLKKGTKVFFIVAKKPNKEAGTTKDQNRRAEKIEIVNKTEDEN